MSFFKRARKNRSVTTIERLLYKANRIWSEFKGRGIIYFSKIPCNLVYFKYVTFPNRKYLLKWYHISDTLYTLTIISFCIRARG